MAIEGLPEVVPPSGRVPGQLLLAAPILKRRRRRYREEMGKITSILGVSSARAIYRRRGAVRGSTREPRGSLTRPDLETAAAAVHRGDGKNNFDIRGFLREGNI